MAYHASSDKADWHRVTDPLDNSTTFYRDDVVLRIEMRSDDLGVHSDNFKEPWANKHADPHASSHYASLYYGPTLIKQYVLVSVDGARATLPLPDRNTLTVRKEDYFVASLHDTIGSLDEYMRRSGLTIE